MRNKPRLAALALTGMLVYASMVSAKALNTVGGGPSAGRAESIVELRFNGQSLSDVMAEVTRRSGVRILIAPQIADRKIDVEIRSGNWSSAIGSLLKGFDHIAIVDRAGSFRKIWIAGRKGDSGRSVGADRKDQAYPFTDDTERGRSTGPEIDQPLKLPVPIWQPLDAGAEPWRSGGELPSMPVQSDPEIFESMRVGQPLEILIPQEKSPLFAVVGEAHSQLDGRVQVWSGPIDGAHETASFTITRGQITTYITVATGSSIYEVSVDNATGLGTVINEVELTKGKTGKDFVTPEEADLLPGRDGP